MRLGSCWLLILTPLSWRLKEERGCMTEPRPEWERGAICVFSLFHLIK